MKSVYFFSLLLISLLTSSAQAAVDIYVKITDTDGNVLTASSSNAITVNDGKNGFIQVKDYMQVASLQHDQEQTLKLSSLSAGAGAGKITFNPLTFTKSADQVSPKLMQCQAAGKMFKTVEILFVKAEDKGNPFVFHRIVLKQAAVKDYAFSSVTDCTDGCAAESFSLEYGTLQVYTYKQQPDGSYVENPYHFGWNRLTNTADQ